jgi:hypothetical protein
VRVAVVTLAAVGVALAAATPASAAKLQAAEYPGMSTFTCRTAPIAISPGQNLNLVGLTQTCPNAKRVSGPTPASVFSESGPGGAMGYITRFKPNMVELKRGGKEVTPSVWDLHLHHVVWARVAGGGADPTFASGEEKTHVKLPQGYGERVAANANWGLNYMIHSLNSTSGRQVVITWEIDWVPDDPPRTDISRSQIKWMDVAGDPQLYPVFDAEMGYDTLADADQSFTFPDEADELGEPANAEEGGKISQAGTWTIGQAGGVTLVFGAGHLHPGGLSVDLEVARDGDDPGSVDGDDPTEVKPLFTSKAKYYEPAGAVSWDVSMEATRPEWRISLDQGDTLSIDTTYDIAKASWYESMGILPLAYTTASDPAARDPFDDAAEVQAMYDEGGILTHGRLPENIDAKARKNLGLPDPRDLKSKGTVPGGGIDIDGFRYQLGGYSASKFATKQQMRPPAIDPSQTVLFNNLDALPGMPETEQAWHSITSCKPPCNRGSGIGYPLANGPIKFDSGQLGYGEGAFGEPVTTGTHNYETPPLTDPGTYTYFCRIHPFMRGSVRVR